MIENKYIRSCKAAAIKKIQDDLCKKESLEVLDVLNCTILPLKRLRGDNLLFGRGGCVDSQNKYIKLSGIPSRIEGNYDTDQLDYLDQEVVYCGYLVRHWGHFLIEAITRLWYALEYKEDCPIVAFITEYDAEYSISGNFKAFFELLGISDIIIINKPTQFRKVIIPESSYSRTFYYSEEYIKILDTVTQAAMNFPHENKHYPEKVFLSRSNFVGKKKNKTEFGLDMLDSFFRLNGYEVLYPERVQLYELVQYLQNAKICAAESGSCAHNLLFARQNSHVEIFERQAYVNEIQANIDVIKCFHTFYVDSYYCLYPVDAAGGPYWLSYTKWFRAFSEDKGYIPPSNKYINIKREKMAIEWYIKRYRCRYGKTIYQELPASEYYNLEVMNEAINETNSVFFEYLISHKPDLKERIEWIKHFPNRTMMFLLGECKYEKLKKRIKGKFS